MTWPTSALGEVCEVVSGATPKTGNPAFWDGDVAWVTPKDLSAIEQKYITDTPRKITEAGLKSCSAKMLPAGSVLFSSRAPIGLVAINVVPVCTNQGFKSMVPRDGRISPDFLYWWLRIHRDSIQRKGRGATFKEVSKKIVEGIQIPLPPLAEQKRIAGILDAADALRAKRRESLAQVDMLLQSTFLDMFGDGSSFESTQLENLASKERYSLSSGPFGSNLTSKHYVDDGVLVLRGLNISSGELSLGDCKYVSEAKAEELERSAVRANDIVIVAVGFSGQAFLIPRDFPRAVLSQNFNKITPDESHVHPVYLVWAVNSPIVQRQFFRNITDTVRTFLSLTKIKKVHVPVPPLDLQHRFATIVESGEQQKARQHAHLAELDTLFASLQSRAFQGGL